MHNIVESSRTSARQWTICERGSTRLMDQYADPFGDIPQPDGSRRGDRYCAPRYLPRGKRL